MSRAAAEKVTGELTVAPLAGAQIFTVLSTVAVQLCAEAWDTNMKQKNRRVTAKSARNEITEGPVWNKVKCKSFARNLPAWDPDFKSYL